MSFVSTKIMDVILRMVHRSVHASQELSFLNQ